MVGHALLFVAALGGGLSAQAEEVGIARTQVFELVPGWNAMYLEVDPARTSPADVFAGLPVDVVATYDRPATQAQFVSNPSADMLNAYGWSVWYSPDRPDDFLTTLFGIYGGKAYLVHAETNATLTVEGTEAPRSRTWRPDAYSFTGVTVDDPGTPTFAEYFRGSPAHTPVRAYRLVNGTWRKVTDPSSTPLRSGEAFWIYTDGRSEYGGPLQVTTLSPIGITVSERGGAEIAFRNVTDHPLTFSVDHVTDPDRPVALSVPVRGADLEGGALRRLTYNFPPGAWTQPFPTLEPGEAIRLPLELRLQEAPAGLSFSTLVIRTDIGTVTRVPVIASTGEPSP